MRHFGSLLGTLHISIFYISENANRQFQMRYVWVDYLFSEFWLENCERSPDSVRICFSSHLIWNALQSFRWKRALPKRLESLKKILKMMPSNRCFHNLNLFVCIFYKRIMWNIEMIHPYFQIHGGLFSLWLVAKITRLRARRRENEQSNSKIRRDQMFFYCVKKRK